MAGPVCGRVVGQIVDGGFDLTPGGTKLLLGPLGGIARSSGGGCAQCWVLGGGVVIEEHLGTFPHCSRVGFVPLDEAGEGLGGNVDIAP